MRGASVLVGGLVMVLAVAAAGCTQSGIEANKRQLDQQKAQLEQLKEQIAALKAAQTPTYPMTMPAPGSCDAAVMHEATKRGGERFAAGDFSRALGYYHDAVTACPGNAQAELNVARAYEALGLRERAIKYYKQASQSTAPDDSTAASQARQALVRLGAH